MQFDPSTARLVEPVSQFDPTTAVPVPGPSTRQILSATSLVAPDVATEAERLAKLYGTTTQSVLADLPTFKRQEEIDRADAALSRSPVLSDVVRQDPYKAPQVRDDLVPLSTLAEMVESFKRGLAAQRRGSDTQSILEATETLLLIRRIEQGEFATDADIARASRYGSMFAGTGRSPENLARMRQRMLAQIRENIADFRARTEEIRQAPPSPELAQFQAQTETGPALRALASAPVRIATQVASESLGALLPFMPLIIVGGAAGLAPRMAALGLSGANAEYLTSLPEIFTELGVDVTDVAAMEAAIRTPEFVEKNRQAMIKAGVIGAGEAIAGGLLGVRMAARPVANVAAQAGVGAGIGGTAEALGSVASGQEVSASAVISDIIGGLPETSIELGARAVRQTYQRINQTEEATAASDTLQAALQTAAESKLRQRSPEEFRAVLEQMGRNTDGTPTQIYVDGEVLNQLAPDVRQLLPQAVREQIQRAAEIGDTVAIPVADVLTAAPGTALEQVLVENARLRPDAMTQAEARAAGDQAAQYLQQEAQRVIEQARDQEAMRTSAEAVRTSILGELNATGRFRPQVNEAMSQWASAFYTTMASRVGITPEEFYQRYRLRVLGEAQPGRGPVIEQGRELDRNGIPVATMAEVQAVADIPTVEKMAQAMDLLGEAEFERRVQARMRSLGATTPEQQAMVTESVAINAVAIDRADAARGDTLQQAAVVTGRPLFEDIVQALGLSEQEFNATALGYMTGLPGGKAFRPPPVGRLTDVVAFLHARRLQAGLPVLDIAKPEDRTRLARLVAAEALAAIRNAGDSLEWYDTTVAKTLSMMAVKYPELDTDPNARNAFLVAVAISSQGMNVEDNLAFARQQYEAFRSTGAYPVVGKGESSQAMADNFEKANNLLAETGPDLFRRFLVTPFTVRELGQAGFDVGGENQSTIVLGSSIFGPKIGFGFYSNLNGNFEPVTMDMWFMRTIGRLAGTLPAFDPAKFVKQVQRLRDATRERGRKERGIYASQFDADLVKRARTDENAAIELARQVKRAHERDFRNNRAAFDAGTRVKTELVGAAETILFSLEKPKDVPASGGERNLLRDVTAQVVDLVAQHYGQRIPPAALQALIWYPEQEFYKAMGVRLRVTSQDYAGAARKILMKEGIDGVQLDGAAERGAAGTRPAGGAAVAAGAAGNVQGAGRARPLTPTEQSQFIIARNARLLAEQRAAAARIAFEVAPDPNDLALTTQWRQLTQEQRLAISDRVSRAIVPRVMKFLKAKGEVLPQVGSYLEDTNPSFALRVDKGDVDQLAKTLGFVLSQDSMMAIAPAEFPGAFGAQALRIAIGEKTSVEVDQIYQTLRAITLPDGRRPIAGQSTSGGVMTVLLDSQDDGAAIGALVDQALAGAYNVGVADVFAAFPEKQDYDYARVQDDPAGNEGVARQRARDARTQASDLLRAELDAIASEQPVDGRGGRSDTLAQQPIGDRARRYSGGSLAPLEGAPNVANASGPDPRLVAVAEQYARDNGIPLRRQAEYVQVDPERAARIAAAYDAMVHAPQDPAVREAYENLIRQTRAQYDALVAAGYSFTFFDSQTDPYQGNPWNAMRDLRANQRMAVYGTYDGYGTEGVTQGAVDDNPMLVDTGLQWPDQQGVMRPVTANDLFRAVHDAFGHGLEGAGFRAQGEENAWQAHVRLFTGSARGAITSETRGQNSWLNFGPYGETNRTAKVEDTVFADQKVGLMPEWTWSEGRAKDEPVFVELDSQRDAEAFRDAVDRVKRGRPYSFPLHVHDVETYRNARLFLSEDGQSGFALIGDEIASFFSGGGGQAYPTLRLAVAQGGRRIDAYRTRMPSVLGRAGFRPVARVEFNPEFATEIWDYEKFRRFQDGRPDLVFFAYDPSFKGDGDVETAGTRLVDYERALELQAQAVREPIAQPPLAQGPRGTFNPRTLELVLSPTADLSTFFHETGHFFLEVMGDVASQPDAPAMIQEDMAKILAWFGVPDLATWNSMTLDQQRPYHERWAESIEQYVMEGKAPSVELAPVMRRFSAWLKSVYQSIKQFLAGRGVVQPGGETLGQAPAPEVEFDDALLAVARQESKAGGAFTYDMDEDAQGVIPGKPRQLDKRLNAGVYAESDIAAAFSKTREMIRAKYGDTVTLWRADAPAEQRNADTRTVYMADKGVAEKFANRGRQAKPYQVAVDDILAVYARPSGYYEVVVRKQALDAPLAQDPTAPAGPPMALNDDIRRVMDRMLATDEQIQQANEVAGLMPDEQADGEAAERLQKRSMADLKWAVKARDKVIAKLKREAREIEKTIRAEVTAEVEQRPEVLAKAAIEKAEKEFEADPVSADMNIAAIADAFGYPSVEAMYRAIDAFGDKRETIDGIVERRMLEENGDLIDERAIREAANEAVHNEARAKSLATELRSQQEMLGQRRDTGETTASGARRTVNVLVEAAKQFGASVIARTPLRDLRATAWKHTSAERRAGKRWQEATMAGDTQAAVKAKQDQMLNNAAAKAALDAAAEAKKILEFFARVTKGNDEKTVEKGRDPDIVNAARAVLAAYGVQTPASKGAAAYLETLKSNDPETYAALEPMIAAAMANAQPLEALTFEELTGLHESIQAFWFMAKRSRQMEVDGNLLDIDDVAQELFARMEQIGIPDRIPGEGMAVTRAEERGLFLKQGIAFLRRVEAWAEGMDGKYGGPFLRFVFQPIKDAADRYRKDRLDYRKRFQGLVDNLAPIVGDSIIEAPELGYTFGTPGSTAGTAMNEILHAIAHTGNDSNKRKLLLGRGWATENADGTLDTTQWDAFIRRLVNEGKLQEAHFDFVQGVWDLLEDTKPLAQKAHRDAFGRYFSEVTANEFVDPFGVTRRGGYLPAQVDTRLVKDNVLRKMAEEQNNSMAYAFPQPAKGFTISRTEYNQPLMLDLRSLSQHIDKVLLFGHMTNPARDVRKLITRKTVSQPLDRIQPAALESMLQPWLQRSAQQIVETPIVGTGRWARLPGIIRARAGMALMFGNVSNAVQQITGLANAAVRVKPSFLMRSLAQYVANPREFSRAVWGASPYMDDRAKNEVAVLNEQMQAILLKPSTFERAQDFSMRHAYFLQTALDNVLSPIVWNGAFNQGLADGMSDADAVRFADSTVRQTQGSTLPEDVSRLETGPAYARVFTQFVGYFNMMANTNATALKQIIGEVGLKKGAGRALYVVMMGLMVPIWAAEAIAIAFRGGPEDEDDDGWLDDWLAEVFGMGTLKGMLAQIPIVGQFAVAGLQRFNDNPLDDRVSLSPAVSLIESSVGAPQSVYKAIVDEGSAQKAIRDVATLVSVATGVPLYGVARPIGYAAGVAQGRIEPEGPLDVARGLITGTASPESRVP